MSSALDIKIASPSAAELPGEFQPRKLRRRALQAIAALGVLFAIVAARARAG